MEDSGALEGFNWEEAEDIGALSERDLKESLEALTEEEKAVDYRQSILQGRIDLIRAELAGRNAGRGIATLSREDLARVLLGEVPGERG